MIECEFGCGAQIYHVPVRFSDGLEILIPRESADSIHYCDFLGPDPNTEAPERIVKVWMEWEWTTEDAFADLSGLEFKNKRHGFKEFLISSLNEFPDFYAEYYLAPRHNLPYCLQKEEREQTTASVTYPNDMKKFHVFELLGLLYQMDGNLEDTKKCFELLLESDLFL